MVCVTCGGQVEAGSRYCPRCGRPVAPGAPGAAGGPAAGVNLIDDLQDRLHRFAGTNRLEGFSLATMFSEVFNALMRERTLDAATGVIHLRAFLSPFGHVAWTAIAAGALWKVKGDRPLGVKMLVDPRFLKPFCIPVVLHMIWNAPLPSPLYARHLAIGFVGWMVVFGLVQDGLRQIRSVQAARRAAGGAVADTTDLVGP